MWKLNNILVNNQKKKQIRKYFEINENEDILNQNSWGAAKAVLRRKCILVNTFI